MEPALARILDANANRAREAARVLEEYARFVLDDATLCGQVKTLRHELVAAVGTLDHAALLAGRDTPGDVGTAVTTDAEMVRGSAEDVALAAAARLTEALRTLEEYGKVIAVDFARRIETLRYAAYDLEQRVALRTGVRRRFASVGLYVLLTESLCSGPWLETAEAVLRGGADAIQLREKGLSDAELLTRARALVELCRRHEALCIVNDRPDVARLARADGVHVGQDDFDVASARRVVGPTRIVGKSTHTLEQARRAFGEEPDYVAVGPMFDSATKPQDHIAGPETLRAVAAETSLPLAAIGGITPDRVPAVVEAGASCLCVCAAIISNPQPKESAAAFKRALIDARSTRTRQSEPQAPARG